MASALGRTKASTGRSAAKRVALRVLFGYFQEPSRLGEIRLESGKAEMTRVNKAAKRMHAREALSRAERQLRTGGRAARTAWLVLGFLAAAVTASAIVWQILDRSEEPDVASDEEAKTENM